MLQLRQSRALWGIRRPPVALCVVFRHKGCVFLGRTNQGCKADAVESKRGETVLTFLSLNDTAKAYILVFLMFSVILLVISLIAHVDQKMKSPRVAALSLFLMASVFHFSILLYFNKINRASYDITQTPPVVWLNSIPCFVYIMLNAIFICFAVLSMYLLYKNSKNQINSFSVKQALENLPTGIAFMTDDVELLLSNHIMHNLCKALTGKALQNAQTFWDDLNALQEQENCVIKGEKPAFALKNEKVWQFEKTMCVYKGTQYYEFKATDITALYRLSENTRSVNEKLIQQKQRLENLADIIEENTENGVALNMKINFHDNFGNLLTLTKKTLRESENTSEAKTLVEYWGNLNGVIEELSSDDRQSLSLEQVLLFAENLGCEIVLSGELPKAEHHKITVLLCVNEMLKNAYRHAGAKKLTVNITHTDSEINLSIQNETEVEALEIKEGSGLSGLRQRIEQTGGTMRMSCDGGVCMFVKLIKEGRQDV